MPWYWFVLIPLGVFLLGETIIYFWARVLLLLRIARENR